MILIAQSASPETQPDMPTGPVILNRFIRAVGGETAIRDIEAMHARGRIIMPEESDAGSFAWWVADGDRCRFEMAFPNLGTSQFGSDGTTGWEVLEIEGHTTTSTLSLEQVGSRRRQANWFELALTLPQRASTFKNIGPAEFDGHHVWEVKMVDIEDRIHHLFFDRTTYLLHGVRMGDVDAADITIRFKQWKPIGPLKLFRVVSINHAGVRLQMNFDHISLEPFPADVFAPSAKTSSSGSETTKKPAKPDA